MSCEVCSTGPCQHVCVCVHVYCKYATCEGLKSTSCIQGAAAFKEAANAQRTPLGSFDPNGKNKVAGW